MLRQKCAPNVEKGRLPVGFGHDLNRLLAWAALLATIGCGQSVTSRPPTATVELVPPPPHVKSSLGDINAWLATHPTDTGALVLRGNRHLAVADWDAAIADYSRALDQDLELSGAYAQRARAWQAKGDLERAEGDLRDAVSMAPEEPGYLFQLGEVQQQRKEYDAAIESFTAAIDRQRVRTEIAKYLVRRAEIFAERAEHDRVIEDCTQAISMDDSSAAGFHLRGMAHVNQGAQDLALADLDRAVELSPETALYHRDRGIVHRLNGQFAKAVEDYSRAIGLSPEDKSLYGLRAIAYRKLGDSAKAAADEELAGM